MGAGTHACGSSSRRTVSFDGKYKHENALNRLVVGS